jgi:hypothetical protein
MTDSDDQKCRRKEFREFSAGKFHSFITDWAANFGRCDRRPKTSKLQNVKIISVKKEQEPQTVDDSPAHRWSRAYQRCPAANLISRSRVILFFGTHQARQLAAAAPVPEFFWSFSHLTLFFFHSNFDRQRCPIFKNFKQIAL